MNQLFSSGVDGAHFRIAETEFGALNEIAIANYGQPLADLSIGKAAGVLRVILIFASTETDRLVGDQGKTIASADMDGQSTTEGATASAANKALRLAVTESGRISLKVVRDSEVDVSDAVPIFEKVFSKESPAT